MTLAHEDAQSWAHARSRSDTPRLGMLEAVAFQAHPEVVATFGDDGATIAALLSRPADTSVRRVGRGLLLLLGICGILSPVAGMVVLGAESYLVDRVTASVSVPIASGAFWVAAAVLVLALIAWWRSGAYWSGIVCGIGVVSALSAGFSAVSMPRVSERDGYLLDPIALLPVWLTLVLGVVLAGALLLRRSTRHPEAESAERPMRPTISDRATAMAAVATLTAEERAAVREDRDAALRILGERTLIDDETLARALQADLGTLFTLDAPRGISA